MSSAHAKHAVKQHYVEQLLDQSQPKRILFISIDDEGLLNNHKELHPNIQMISLYGILHYEHFAINECFDIAIVVGQCEHQTKKQGQHLIAYLRNKVAHQVLLLLDKTKASELGWKDSDFFALGMQKNKVDQQLLSFSYDLDKYNHKRTWNNPQFWANPEQFNQKISL